MKKTIALATAILLSSSLLVGCGNNTAGPDINRGVGNNTITNRAGTMTTDRGNAGLNALNMRADRNLEKQVNTVLGTGNARVYVTDHSAYVMLDKTNMTGNRAGTMGTGTMNRTGAYGTGVGDRTVVDGTGGNTFSNRETNPNGRGGFLGLGGNNNNRGGLFGGDRDTNGTGGLFGTRNNITQNNTYGTSRSSTLNTGRGTGIPNTPTADSTGGAVTGNTTGINAGDFTGRGAAGGTATGYGYGTGYSPRSLTNDTSVPTATRNQIAQLIQKADPSIQNVYFVTPTR